MVAVELVQPRELQERVEAYEYVEGFVVGHGRFDPDRIGPDHYLYHDPNSIDLLGSVLGSHRESDQMFLSYIHGPRHDDHHIVDNRHDLCPSPDHGRAVHIDQRWHFSYHGPKTNHPFPSFSSFHDRPSCAAPRANAREAN